MVLIITFLYLTYIFLTSLLCKTRRDILGCGLVGYSGKALVDEYRFKLNMLYNMSRGTHAAGISIDNRITKEAKSVDTFLSKWIFNFSKRNTTTVIGHTRQASQGISSKDDNNAHPFGVYHGGKEGSELYKEIGSDEFYKQKPEFILAMNGTIDNMYTLNTTYKTGYTYNDSDSLHLAKIMHKLYKDNMHEVLEMYTGAATLLFYWPEDKNTLYVWKDPERPLWYYQKDDDTMYISSLRESLWAIGGGTADTFEFEGKHLYKITEGKIISKVKHEKAKKTTYSNYNDWENGKYVGKAVAKELPFNGGVIVNKAGSFCKVNNTGKVYFKAEDLKYYRGGHVVTGRMNLKPDGKENSPGNNTGTDFWFIRGVMMKDEKACEAAKLLATKDNKFSKYDFETLTASSLSAYSMYPVKSKILEGGSYKEGELYTGIITPKFSSTVLEFKNGKLTSSIMSGEDKKNQNQPPAKLPTAKDITDLLANEIKDYSASTYLDLADNVKVMVDCAALEDNDEFNQLIFDCFLEIARDCNVYRGGVTHWVRTSFKEYGAIDSVANELTKYLQEIYSSDTPSNEDVKESAIVNLANNKMFCEDIEESTLTFKEFLAKWYEVLEATGTKDSEQVFDNMFLVYKDLSVINTEDFKRYLEENLEKKRELAEKIWFMHKNFKLEDDVRC